MIETGLIDGDLLVIDWSLNPENGKIVVCLIDDEYTVKRIKNISQLKLGKKMD